MNMASSVEVLHGGATASGGNTSKTAAISLSISRLGPFDSDTLTSNARSSSIYPGLRMPAPRTSRALTIVGYTQFVLDGRHQVITVPHSPVSLQDRRSKFIGMTFGI